MYHRVGDGGEDPWGLAVSPRQFAEQMAVLRRRRRVVGLTELVARLTTGRPLGELAVVTFDDGYADNLTAAKPVLASLAIPATVFVVAAAIGAEAEFWWDELGRILLEPGPLPAALSAAIDGARRSWPLGAARDYSPMDAAAHRSWRVGSPPPTERHSLYIALWRLLRRQAPGERERILAELRQSAGIAAAPRPHRRTLSASELVALGDGGLIEIGGHSLTHAALPEQPAPLRDDEIRRGKHQLESLLGRAVGAFAYPFGEYDDASVASVRGARFACAVTTDAKPVPPQCDPFRLPRIAVADWDGEQFNRRLVAGFR